MLNRVYVVNKDYRGALFFISLLSTILYTMEADMIKFKKKGRNVDEFDFEPYEEKMYAYETVYDAIIEEFTNDVFGLYSNSVESEDFVQSLTTEGWKYFDLKNLNELFALKYHEKIESGSIEALADIEEHESADEESFFKTKIDQSDRVNQTTITQQTACTTQYSSAPASSRKTTD